MMIFRESFTRRFHHCIIWSFHCSTLDGHCLNTFHDSEEVASIRSKCSNPNWTSEEQGRDTFCVVSSGIVAAQCLVVVFCRATTTLYECCSFLAPSKHVIYLARCSFRSLPFSSRCICLRTRSLPVHFGLLSRACALSTFERAGTTSSTSIRIRATRTSTRLGCLPYLYLLGRRYYVDPPPSPRSASLEVS